MSDGDEEITPGELNELLEAGEDVRIVDIRSRAEFDRGSIPGSENVPFGNLPREIEGLAGADRIVTVCPHGKASLQAVRIIDSYEGTTGRVQSLEGGIEAWRRDYALESAEGSETDVPDAPF
ncbi:rhodanese-like domain-containing protein [Halalkalicoccus sp. NIPERK01]|uniref:rhodanese-like domain-containing protein n=1 Tax=Halalkalicoccus sp. NIPERK01 TaxID=3053469 RepID=UPI00256F2308|nr:rhodanese-like domain-containing protein [Halalkalicoccus sp. NIPERK01]MDL5361761.1 rhodanese-like domain-containing protein [Halalkalicoccus sp. NIPERK01]